MHSGSFAVNRNNIPSRHFSQVIQLPATGVMLTDDAGDNLNAPSVVPSEFVTNSLFSITKGESAYDGEVHLGIHLPAAAY